MLDTEHDNGCTTGVLCLGRAACRESTSFPPCGGESFTCLALGKALVERTGCVFLWDAPLPCSLIRCSSAPWLLVPSHERWWHSYFPWVWYRKGILRAFKLSRQQLRGDFVSMWICLSLLGSQIHPMWTSWHSQWPSHFGKSCHYKWHWQSTSFSFALAIGLTSCCFKHLLRGSDAMVSVCHSAALLLRGSFWHWNFQCCISISSGTEILNPQSRCSCINFPLSIYFILPFLQLSVWPGRYPRMLLVFAILLRQGTVQGVTWCQGCWQFPS